MHGRHHCSMLLVVVVAAVQMHTRSDTLPDDDNKSWKAAGPRLLPCTTMQAYKREQ